MILTSQPRPWPQTSAARVNRPFNKFGNRVGSCFALLLVVALPNVSTAQVVIEERVEISGTTIDAVTDPVTQSKTTVTAIEPLFDGWLELYYSSAHKLRGVLDPNAWVGVVRDGQIIGVDSALVNERYQSEDDTSPNPCSSGTVTSYNYEAGSAPQWRVGRVNKGDEIQLGYDGNDSTLIFAPQYTLNGSAWTIHIGAFECFDGQEVIFKEEIELSAAIVRDTLTIEIDDPKEVWPEILTGHYPERSTEFNQSEVDNTIGVFVKMQAASGPVIGQQVKVVAEWVEESGGHYHGSHAELTCDPNTGSKGFPTGVFR
jgi:hypothetical protein